MSVSEALGFWFFFWFWVQFGLLGRCHRLSGSVCFQVLHSWDVLLVNQSFPTFPVEMRGG